MRRFTVPLVILALLVSGFAGYYSGRIGLDKLRQDYRNEQKLNLTLQQDLRYQKATVFYLKSTDTALFLQPITQKVKTDPDLYQAIVNVLLQGPPKGSGLLPIFPKGSKAITVKVKDGLAEVNLNQRTTQLNVGAAGEALAIGSIVNTLTKLPGIFKVRILIEGNEAESLAGHVDLTQTFTYNSQIMAPEYR